jgi:hypothetical protein
MARRAVVTVSQQVHGCYGRSMAPGSVSGCLSRGLVLRRRAELGGGREAAKSAPTYLPKSLHQGDAGVVCGRCCFGLRGGPRPAQICCFGTVGGLKLVSNERQRVPDMVWASLAENDFLNLLAVPTSPVRRFSRGDGHADLSEPHGMRQVAGRGPGRLPVAEPGKAARCLLLDNVSPLTDNAAIRWPTCCGCPMPWPTFPTSTSSTRMRCS